MHPSLVAVLMHVCVVSSPTASFGARRSEVHSVGSPDATHRLSVASVSPTSIGFAGRRETETLYRSMDFSIRGHSVAPEHDAGYPTRFSGRSETAREPPLRLGSTTVASLSGARGMHRHSSALPRVGGRGGAPSRHRGWAVEHLISRREEEHDEDESAPQGTLLATARGHRLPCWGSRRGADFRRWLRNRRVAER